MTFWSEILELNCSIYVSMLQVYPDGMSKKISCGCYSGTICTSVAAKQRLVHVALHLLWWMDGEYHEVCLLLIKFLVAPRGTVLEKLRFFYAYLLKERSLVKANISANFVHGGPWSEIIRLSGILNLTCSLCVCFGIQVSASGVQHVEREFSEKGRTFLLKKQSMDIWYQPAVNSTQPRFVFD